jgi:hypothetical protein
MRDVLVPKYERTAVNEFVDTCKPCQASQPKTTTKPIKQTPYPDGPWQQLHANFKGSIAGTWYLHVLIGQYSKFPVVTVDNTMGWESLKTELDDSFACHKVPEEVMTDGGPPYGSQEIAKYCKTMGSIIELQRPSGLARGCSSQRVHRSLRQSTS